MTQPILTTQRLTLRPFAVADAIDVSRLAGTAEVFDTTENIPHPYTLEAAESWIATLAADYASGNQISCAICAKSGGDLLGGVGLRFDQRNRRGTLGYWLAVEAWGKGYATESAREVMRWGFEDYGLNRITAQYLLRNPASGRVMEKLGMQQEAILRSWAYKHDVFEDVAQWYVLATDFLGIES